MATDSVQICNLAIDKLDGNSITSLSATGSKESRLCNDFYAQDRDELLQGFKWTFARKRYYQLYTDQKKTISGLSLAGDIVTLTVTGHGLSAGETFTPEDVGGTTSINGNTYQASVSDANTIVLQDRSGSNVDASSFSAWTSGGTIRRKPWFRWEYSYELPTDFLSDVNEDDNIIYELDGGLLHTDSSELNLIYIKKVTDTTKHSKMFDRLLIDRLAVSLAFPLTADLEKKKVMDFDLRVSTALATEVDSRKGNRRQDKKTSGKRTWVSTR